MDARKAGKVFRVVQREGMGRARIEPDIENVVDLFVFFRVVFGLQEARGGAVREPGVRALLFEGVRDALVDLLVDENFLCVLIDEDRDRHAPGALARDHPVRAVGDHAGDAVFARGGIPFGPGDLAQRDLAQGGCIPERPLILRSVRSTRLEGCGVHRLVERDEPLRRVAEDERLFRAPGMRILML